MKTVSTIKIDLKKYPKTILDTLHRSSYKAYIVGGCVRDSILGKAPSDFDITTSASPIDVKKLFKRTFDTGIKHGTVTVVFYENDKPYTYEVTTFRKDGDYEDMRHPKAVEFVDDLREDLLRRDFTVNAMAYNEEEGLIDIFGGLVDLDKKLIRAVGNPIDRFNEDALRLMRAVRFAAKLGFKIEDETLSAIPKLANNLSAVSKERVQVELTKTITSDNPSYVKLYFDLGLAPYICDGFEKIHRGKLVKGLSTYMAYTSLLYNTNFIDAEIILRSLKLDNNTINACVSLLKSKKYIDNFKKFYNSRKYGEFQSNLKDLISEIGYELTSDFSRLIEINENAPYISMMRNLIDSFKVNNDPIFLSELAVTGDDMMKIGLKGQEIGIALYYLLKIVHKNKKYNKKETLINLVSKAQNMCREAYYEL